MADQAPLPMQQPETPGVADTPETERAFVQNVYDNIADHFSRTRYAVCQAVHSNKSESASAPAAQQHNKNRRGLVLSRF